MTRSFDVLIVGAGIVGTACALECTSAGLDVCVVESTCIGGGATAEGMGHLVVLDDSEAQLALTRYSQQLWNEVADELPADVQFFRCGTLWVAADREELDAVRPKKDTYHKCGLEADELDGVGLLEVEPNLREGFAGGLRVPGDSVIYPPTAASYFLQRAIARGASYVQGHVCSLDDKGVSLRNGSRIDAGIVVNAAGVWASSVTPEIPVRRRKGHLVITDRYPDYVRHQIIELGYLKSAHSKSEDSVAANIQPRPNGQLLIGSSRQFGVESRDVEPDIVRRMLARAGEYLPALPKLSVIRVWTGFRDATPDKLPFVGPSPWRNNVWYACGNEGLGITTSLACAKLLVDQIVERAPTIPVEPYLPQRVLENPSWTASN